MPAAEPEGPHQHGQPRRHDRRTDARRGERNRSRQLGGARQGVTIDIVYDRLSSNEGEALNALLCEAFWMSPELVASERQLAGDGGVRVLRVGGEIVACLVLLEMDQYFGGRPVRCAGIAAVAVGGAHRGRGLGTVLMREMLGEMRGAGVPVSALYPATLPVYHKAGYARAGTSLAYRMPMAALAGVRADLAMRRIAAADEAVVRELKREEARRGNGLVDRPEYLWAKKFRPRGRAVTGFLIGDAAGPEGYVLLTGHGEGRLEIVDHCALTPRAALRLLAFLGAQRAQVATFSWLGAPEDPLALLTPEVGATVEQWEQWLLRVIDVERALAARGYPPGLEAELVLDVTDADLPWNDGRFRLSIGDGRGRVERLDRAATAGGDPLRLDVRALAALFTGHLSAQSLRAIGGLTGGERAIGVAALIFSGPRPWLADRF